MFFKKKHVIVFLLDSTRINGAPHDYFMEVLNGFQPRFPKSTKIYFLNIKTPYTEQKDFRDEVSVVRADRPANRLEPIMTEPLNLRSTEGLKRVFSFIKKKYCFSAKYYFISCGHGTGMSIDIRSDESIEKSVSADLMYECIWNVELAEALTILKPYAAIFNNCYVNFLDSINYFRTNVQFLIAAERYQCPVMLDLKLIFECIDNFNSGGQSHNGKALFNAFEQGINDALKRGTTRCDFPCLFLIDLAKAGSFLNLWNQLCRELRLIKTNDWFLETRKSLYLLYISTENFLVDQKVFLRQVNELPLSKKIKDISETLIEQMDSGELIMDKNTYGGGQERNGITIYLPRGEGGISENYFHTIKFREYYALYTENLLRDFEWYTLLNEIYHRQYPEAVIV